MGFMMFLWRSHKKVHGLMIGLMIEVKLLRSLKLMKIVFFPGVHHVAPSFSIKHGD